MLSSKASFLIDRESKQERPCSTEVKQQVIGSMSNYQLDAGADARRTQGVSLTSAFADDIINEREKLKETDEYKRAMEEEWASRQRQLQIQVHLSGSVSMGDAMFDISLPCNSLYPAVMVLISGFQKLIRVWRIYNKFHVLVQT